MGFIEGDYLPPLAPVDIVIATLTLESSTQDLMELRAKLMPGGQIGLKWVDEYYGVFDVPKEVISHPLSFKELIEFIEGTSCEAGSLPLCFNNYNYAEDCDAESYRRFTQMHSSFYPCLSDWMQHCADLWVEKCLADQDQDQDEKE